MIKPRSLLARLILWLPLWWTLSACSGDSPEQRQHTYLQRLSTALEQPLVSSEAHPLPHFPPRRERLLPLMDMREGVIDVLDLRHCADLLPLIAERNSSLGRVQTASARLQYELRFLPTIADCEVQLEHMLPEQPELATVLQRVRRIHALKRAQLPDVIWNGIYTSEEMEAQFQRNAAPLALDSEGQLADLSISLQRFIQLVEWLQRGAEGTPPALHGHDYERLYRNRFGSEWMKSVQQLTLTLEQASMLIEARLARRPLCLSTQPTERGLIARNVLQQHYMSTLQPYVTRIQRDGAQWRQLHQQLLTTLPAPASSRDYFEALFATEEDSLWQRFQLAQQTHTRAWQTLLSQCGLLPAAP